MTDKSKNIEVEYSPESAAKMLSSLRPGMPDSFEGFTLRKASVYQFKNVARLDFMDSVERTVSIWATPASSAKSHFKTSKLDLTLQVPKGKPSADYQQRLTAMMELFLKSFSDVSISDLEKSIIEKSGRTFNPDFSNMTDLNLFFDSWGDPDQELQFFHYDAVWRYYFICYSYRHDGSIRVKDKSIYITHGDSECPRNFYFDMPGLDKYFSFPWHIDSSGGAGEHSAFYSTDLEDMDIIDGGVKKLSNMLKDVAATHEFDVAFVNVTCLSMIIGDDVESAVREFKKRTGVPVILINALKLSIYEHLKDLIEFSSELKSGETPLKTSVNLVGFPPNAGRDELAALLSKLGVSINMYLLPDISIKEMRSYLNAGLQAFHPGGAYNDIRENILEKLPIESIAPAAPYGVTGTLDFLQQCAAATGTAKEFSKFSKERLPEIASRLKDVISRVDGLRIGIVISSRQIDPLASSFITWGIPFLSVLEEFGFTLQVMIHSKSGIRPDTAPIENFFMDLKRHEIVVFSNKNELDALLEKGNLSAVYSDIYYDDRLTANGIPGFSVNVFEPGFEGAFRSAERLLNICQTPFYRKYSSYLSGRKNDDE